MVYQVNLWRGCSCRRRRNFKTLIADANRVLNEVKYEAISGDTLDIPIGSKYVTSEAKTALEEAIATANDADDTESARTTLQQAIDTFNKAIKVAEADTQNLETKISEAEDAKDDYEISEDGLEVTFDEKYVTNEDINTLTQEISKAEDIKNNPETQRKINEAVTALDEAIILFNAAAQTAEKDTSDLDLAIQEANEEKQDVETSEDGEGVDPGSYWVKSEDMIAFNAAIQIAAAAKTSATNQKEINDAVKALEQAIETFSAQKNLAD